MKRQLKLKAGAKIPFPDKVFEEYETGENWILANVGVDKIEEVMQHFILMHDEPLFFILELPAKCDEETEIEPGIVEKLHKNVYYIDGCSQDDALLIMLRVGNLIFNDGLSAFGYGCHESHDEIMFGKYNVLKIYSENIEEYKDFFEEHDIERTDNLITAWDTFSADNPGESDLYEINGRSVYDIPQQLKKWGMYLAEQREE